MKRRIRVILLFLVLGAVVNYAVAWGCVARTFTLQVPNSFADQLAFVMQVSKQLLPEEQALWAGHQPAGFPVEPCEIMNWEHFGVEWRFLSDLSVGLEEADINSADSLHVHSLLVVRSGWPMVALQGRLWEKEDPVSGTIHERHLEGVCDARRADLPEQKIRPLPYVPMWPGFLLNTALYAATLWLIIRGPGCLRRRLLRSHLGQCLGCGYEMRAHTPGQKCPECGTIWAG